MYTYCSAAYQLHTFDDILQHFSTRERAILRNAAGYNNTRLHISLRKPPRSSMPFDCFDGAAFYFMMPHACTKMLSQLTAAAFTARYHTSWRRQFSYIATGAGAFCQRYF